MSIARLYSLGIAAMLAMAPAGAAYAAHQALLSFKGTTQGKIVGGPTKKNPRPGKKILPTKISQ
jgi:hypothetical protein